MKELHLICNSHIDPVWQWDWEEGLGVTISTFLQAAKFAEDYDYVFCHNESLLYEYVQESDPELFSTIKNLVEEGRWAIAGGWYLQPDANLPSGEAMVRQIKLGREYFQKEFGKRPTTAYNFDSFGHSKGLVQILRKCGYDGYMICRPMPQYMPLEDDDFIWEGPDGSTIKVARVNDEAIYTSSFGTALEEIKRKKGHYEGKEYGLALWGVGNHGGVNSKKDLDDVTSYIKESKDCKVIHSTPEGYIAKINPTLKVSHSLPILRGAYSSMSSIKQMNSRLESKLFSTEKLCSFAESVGVYSKNEEAFLEAEKCLACVEFHDCLSGTIVESGEVTSLRKGEHALYLLQKEFDKAFLALITKAKKAELESFPIFLWNGSTQERELVEETELLIPKAIVDDERGYLPTMFHNGKEIPCQVIDEEGSINMDRRKRLAYKIKARPFSVERVDVRFQIKPKTVKKCKAGGLKYQDSRKSLTISGETGLLESYIVDGKEMLSGPAFLPYMYEDNADPWGWDLIEIGTNGKPFALTKGEKGPFQGRPSVAVVEEGDVLTEVESLFELSSTYVKVSYKIYKDLPYIDVSYHVLWNEQEKALKVKVPTAFEQKPFMQIMFGEESLENEKEEYVGQRYLAVKEEDSALALINKGVYSFSYEGKTLLATLLRGAAYCAHPIEKRPIICHDRYTPYIEQGERDFHFRFGLFLKGELENEALCFNEGVHSLNFFPHGKGGDYARGFEIDNPSIALESLYKDGDHYVFRLFNNNPFPSSCSFKALGVEGKADFKKYEVKSFILKDGEISEQEYWC